MSDVKLHPGALVEYEQHGKTILGMLIGERKNKWALVNTVGKELELPASRLYLFPSGPDQADTTIEEKARYLQSLDSDADKKKSGIVLAEIWEIVSGEKKEFNTDELTEIACGENSLVAHLAFRQILLADKIYFKRRKYGFEPRPKAVVEELKKKEKVERAKDEVRETLRQAILERLKDPTLPLPASIRALEELAAFGGKAEGAKDIVVLLNDIIDKEKLDIGGKSDQKAFELLVRIKRFSPDENLTLRRLRRPIGFSDKALKEAEDIRSNLLSRYGAGRQPLSASCVVSIDSPTTPDIDDALSLETIDGNFQLGVHISDVASVIAEHSALEEEVFSRGTSIYCPDQLISMLPDVLSEDALSLVAKKERLCISYYVTFDDTFNIIDRKIERSIVSVTHRLSYSEANNILCDESPQSPAENMALSAMLTKLWQIASALEERRIEAGATQFNRRDFVPVLTEGGRIELEIAIEDTPSHKLVGEMMILANETAALFGSKHSIPFLYRSQEAPDVDIRSEGQHLADGPAKEYFLRGLLKRSAITTTPLSHFGLGLEAYTQITSPIRRAVDLLNQRQLLNYLTQGSFKYSPSQMLEKLAALEGCLDEARQIQFERNRYFLGKYIVQEKIKEFGATIVRVDGPKPLAELDTLIINVPFFSLGYKRGDNSSLAKRLGERIRLRVDEVNPRREILRLSEIG